MFTNKLYSALFGLHELPVPVAGFRGPTRSRRRKVRPARIRGDKLATKAMNHQLGLGHPR